MDRRSFLTAWLPQPVVSSNNYSASGNRTLSNDLTPWAPEFSSLLARGNLRDTGPYRGLLATWFSRLPFVGLLIDHVLVSPDIGILANRVGADLGSDHLPVIADLTVATEPQ